VLLNKESRGGKAAASAHWSQVVTISCVATTSQSCTPFILAAPGGMDLPAPDSRAREKVEEWRTEYNEVRPHSAIGDRTPLSLIYQPHQHAEAPNPPEILT
jgi:hypothetical protein